MTTEQITNVIMGERAHQDQKWGGKEHDVMHHPHAFIIFMEHYLTRAKFRISTEDSWDGALEELRKVVALGYACFEVYGVPERKTEN